MNRGLAVAAFLAAFLSVGVGSAGATTPTPCPTPSASSDSRVTCGAPAVDPIQAAYELLKTRLGGDIAQALDAEQKLTATLDQFAATADLLAAEVAQEEAVIAQLEDEIAKLDLQIADTQARIEVEK